MRSSMFQRPRGQTPIAIRVQSPTNKAEWVNHEIMAEVFGHWAVHRTVEDSGREATDRYTVTHIKTGFYAACDLDRKTALRLADTLKGVIDTDEWDEQKHVPILKRELVRVIGRVG